MLHAPSTTTSILVSLGVLIISSCAILWKHQKQSSGKDKRFRRKRKELKIPGIPGLFPGILNVGNTCYMNSSLQVLAGSKGFLDSLRSLSFDSHGPIQILLKFFERLNDPTEDVIDPRQFIKDLFGNKLGRGEQDAHEFMQLLLATITGKLRRPARYDTLSVAESMTCDLSIFSKLLPFEGIVLHEIKCMTCNGFSSLRMDYFNILTLPVSASLEESLSLFSVPEHLEGYKCEQCQRVDQCWKRVKVLRWPKILVVHFNRLCISPFGLLKDNQPMLLKDTFNGRQLLAFMEHLGTPHSGHYVAFRKLTKTYWQHISDAYSVVCKKNTLATCSPYIAVYELKEEAS